MGEWFPKQRIGDLPARAAARWGPREALVFEGRRWSFAEFSGEVDRVARGLIAAGVQPGERVGLWLDNRPEWLAALFAIVRIGAVLLPVNTRLRAADLGYVLAQSDTATLILAERSGPVAYLEMIEALRAEGAARPAGAPEADTDPAHPPLSLERLIMLGDPGDSGGLAWDDALAGGERVTEAELQARAEAVSPDDTAFMLYTSGTTGLPKGVMHSHAIVRNVTDRAWRLAITEADTILNYLPLFHIFGFSEAALTSLVTGARQVLTARFDPDESLDLLEAERATVAHGFDIHFQALMEAQARRPRDLSSFRTGILAAGMASSVPIARETCRRIGPTVSAFGMSEFGVGAALSPLDASEEQRCEASGYPAPGYEIRVIDPATGAEMPTGEPGEIVVRSYMTMQGYYNKPEETARTVDAEGWVHTGDVGIIRPDGHLRFMGRYKDMLKVGGENVDAMEVEAFLMTRPEVNLAAVVGLPDRRLGEVPVAFVRPEPGRPFDPEALIEGCRGQLAGYKIPRHVIAVEDFPMTGSGKIRKVDLRAEAEKRFGGGVPPRE